MRIDFGAWKIDINVNVGGPLIQKVLDRLDGIEKTIRTLGDKIMADVTGLEGKVDGVAVGIDTLRQNVGTIIQDVQELKVLAAAAGTDQAAVDRMNTKADDVLAKLGRVNDALTAADTDADPTPGGPGANPVP